MKQQKGFTLIEILIVISIIGVLSALTLVGMGGFRASGRDARRMSDLRQIQNGLELYYAKIGYYPTSTTWDDFATQLASAGVKNLPIDPTNSGDYVYKYTKCQTGDTSGYNYVLSVKLETSTSQIKPYGSNVCGVDCGINGNVGDRFCIPF